MFDSIVTRAMQLAIDSHNDVNQLRKYTNEPYWVHPGLVAGIVSSVKHNSAMLAAAWLHDVVEDTGVPLSFIKAEFGDYVAMLVSDLTDVSKPEDGNRSIRKAIDLNHTSLALPEAKTIKLADLIANTSSIVTHDKDFAKIYLQEKSKLLDVLKEGDPILHKMATDLLLESILFLNKDN